MIFYPERILYERRIGILDLNTRDMRLKFRCLGKADLDNPVRTRNTGEEYRFLYLGIIAYLESKLGRPLYRPYLDRLGIYLIFLRISTGRLYLKL